MGYEVAINKAWESLLNLKQGNEFAIKFLGDEYSVDIGKRSIQSLSCNVPAKDYFSILILHYLAAKIKGLPVLKGEWSTFRELSGVEGYGEAFRKRVVERIIRKYGNKPEELASVLSRIPGRVVKQADAAVVLDCFAGVPLLIELWKADAEFAPEANVLFDQSIKEIFCIEDIIVLAEIAAGQL